jgi:hypothetical protein
MLSALDKMLLNIRVKPSSKHEGLQQQPDGTWVARVKAAPVDGQANARLIELLAKHFHCSKSCICIKSGTSSRIKRIEITD